MRGWRWLAVATLVAVAGCGGGDASSPSRASGRATESSSIPPRNHLEIDGGPDWLAADDQWLYVKLDSGAVARVDPRTATVMGTTPIGGSVCQGIGVGFGAVWACKDSDVVRIDPARDEVVATIAVAKVGEQGHLVNGFGRVWVIVDDGRQLVGIDPTTNRGDAPIVLPIRATELALDSHHLWAVSAVDRALVRIDPTTGNVEGRVDNLGDVVNVASDGATVFVAAPEQVTRIDATTLATISTIAAGPGSTGGVTITGSDLWIHRAGQLMRVPGGTGAPVSVPFEINVASGGDVLVAFDFVWASANDDGVVLRVPLP